MHTFPTSGSHNDASFAGSDGKVERGYVDLGERRSELRGRLPGLPDGPAVGEDATPASGALAP